MSVRLSPAANLLRNSKLFALPPAIALPTTPPSSDQVSSSDTATTVYPRYAAIETTYTSAAQGDWGFKRPLPLKATRTTNNPVVRLVRGIDTPEHVADFESAADHALTLRKFQELNIPIQLQAREYTGGYRSEITSTHRSVFAPTHDNISTSSTILSEAGGKTGVWPEVKEEEVFSQLPDRLKQIANHVEEERKAAEAGQPDPAGARSLEKAATARAHRQRLRWRFSGPSLIQLSGMEFDQYLHSLGQKEKDILASSIKRHLLRQKMETAREEGKMGEQTTEQSVTKQEVAEYIRRLRNNPTRFGPILAEMLDLPEGPSKASRGNRDVWEYGRIALATDAWTMRGPPRTHPSAGLSYLKSAAFAHNHPSQGPQKYYAPVVARAVKTRNRPVGGNDVNYGVAGFIVPNPGGDSMKSSDSYVPQPGGLKIPLRPTDAYVSESGSLHLRTNRVSDYDIYDDKPLSSMEKTEMLLQQQDTVRQAAPAPKMSDGTGGYQPRVSRRLQEQGRESTENEDLQRILRM